jgi:nucleotide-binding universal stress UspA family protein
MYHSLLVPLDGSAFGEQALPLALGIARRAGAALQVVQVHVPYALMYADSMSPLADVREAKYREQERAYLDAVVKRLGVVTGVPVTSALLEGPVPAAVLAEYAVSARADLVVMTTHGRGPLTRAWLGSVADELIRLAPAPVLLVRPREAAPGLAQEPVLRHILIPLDGAPLAERILEPAVELGNLMQADYTLLRVVAAGPVGPGPAEECKPPIEQLRVEALAYLRHVAEGLQGRGLPIRTQVAVGHHPAVAILDEAQARAVDLIALETHGRRGLRRLVLGSVADKVVRGACTPVLVHRSRAE